MPPTSRACSRADLKPPGRLYAWAVSHPDRQPTRYVEQVRAICLGFPETTEKKAWGHPTFRVRDKIFASVGYYESGPGVGAPLGAEVMTMKAADGEQEVLLAQGHPFFYPKYVGPKGWIGVVLDDDTDFEEIAELVEDSYRQIAPRKLAARLDAEPPAPLSATLMGSGGDRPRVRGAPRE